MIQANPNISFNKGDSVLIQIALYTAVGSTTPATLTAPTGHYAIAASPYSTAAMLSKTSSQVNFTQDPASLLWTMNVPLSAADTAILTVGALFHQAQVVDTDGTSVIVVSAMMTVMPSIPML